MLDLQREIAEMEKRFRYNMKTNKNRRQAHLESICIYSNGTNRCAWEGCTETRIDAFVLDHINGGGRKEQDEHGHHLVMYLKRMGFPDRDKRQVLCQNHNMDKVTLNNERHINPPKTPEEARLREKNQLKNLQLKIETFTAYSNGEVPKCKVCGEININHLCLDHTKGDGSEDRKINGSGTSLYAKLRRLGFPNKDKYQVLCYSCNQIKMKENKEYPKKTKEKMEKYKELYEKHNQQRLDNPQPLNTTSSHRYVI